MVVGLCHSNSALLLRRGSSHGPCAREWVRQVLIKLDLHKQAVGQICPAGSCVSPWSRRAPGTLGRPTCASGTGAGQRSAVVNPVGSEEGLTGRGAPGLWGPCPSGWEPPGQGLFLWCEAGEKPGLVVLGG